MEKVKLGQLTNIKTGRLDVNAENPNGKYPFFTCSKNHTYIDEYAFDGESVLVAGNGDLNVKYYNGKFNAYQRTYVIQANENLNGKFLYYFLDSYVEKLREQSIGGVIKYIKLGNLTDAEIPLPNLATQQRIAAILDQAEAIIQNNRAIVQKYDALTQSLFLDMFGDPVKNEKRWEMKTLKDLGTSRLGKMLDGKKIIGNNLKPYLRNSNVQWFRFELNDLLKMDFDEKDKVEFSLKVGDILMCEGGEIGRCAIWKDEIEDCYFQKAIHRIRLNNKYVLPEYFVYMFKNIADNGGLDEFKSAATISHLTGEKLKKMRMPIPPIEIQNQFAELVAMIEAQKEQAQLELAKSEELFASLLQRAFKGELN